MLLGGEVYSLTHGTSGLLLWYLMAFVPMIWALIKNLGPVREYFEALWLFLIMILIVGIFLEVVTFLLHHVGVTNAEPVRWILGLPLTALLGYRCGEGMALQSVDGHSHRRGAVVLDALATLDLRRRHSERSGKGGIVASPITLAGISVSLSDETKHFKLRLGPSME